ncbi:CHAP domain-containing protein [Pleomorphomonas oryzae]|uniref:CHAP domain-containing protein n=1 Tax=Pleomorphomonas oryzae TaxID=261934 RepID=UPI0012EC17B9|nr:CHAP domain-containing protein [Pleomorphomonas oryzae]
MLNRRSTLSLLPATLMVGAPHGAAAQSSPPTHDVLELLRPEDDPTFGPLISGQSNIGGAVVGVGPSRHEEIQQAFRILLDAPRGAPLLSVVRYFEQIAKTNEDGEKFNAEWKSRSNPLITGMFGVTGTSPSSGDQTSWCAAFVSTCLYIALLPNEYTALSGGYRNFGSDAISDPKEGDIAVFSKFGPEGTKGFGHVGFFLRNESRNGKDGIIVLGGNQRGSTGTTGAVTEAWFASESEELYLHGIRRIPGV